MLNVKNLTDTMSRMELPQLQQYAALHKNDPYIVTLALSIANQKKQMKAGQAGQAGMQPQPKVADQQIAQMVAPPPQQMAAAPQQQALPEDQGIGQLPAQNMQNMAEGGIVAFDDGGRVPGFAGPAGSYIDPSKYVRSTTGGKDWFLDVPETVPDPSVPYYKPIPNPIASAVAGKTFKSRQEAIDAVNALTKPAVDPSTTLPVGTNYTPPNMPAAMTGSNAAPVDVNKVLADKTTADKTQPLVEKSGILNLPINTPAASALNTTPLTAEQAMTASQKFGDETALKAGIAKLDTDAVNTNAAIQAANTEGLAKLAKPGTEAEARLKAREAQDVVGQADAKAMAIFKAGLGMMAGTSQHAFENIGKGAMAGLEDYSASIKDFRKLGIERDKAYAEIEAARNAAARDDFKTSLGLQEKGADRLARAHEKGVDLTASLFKTNKETAATIYRDSFDQAQQNQRTQVTEAGATGRTLIQERGANARTQAQLAAPPAEARMAMMLGTGKTDAERLESGMRKIQEIGADKTGAVYASMYAKHIEESRKNLTEPMSPQEFATSMRGILAAMSPKPPAPLNQPAGQVRQ
jgi:hypothetical protein